MAVRSYYDEVCIDTAGNALANVEVTVYDVGTTNPVTIYNTRAGGGAKTNPVTTGVNGLVNFYADPKTYSIKFHDAQSPARFSDRTIDWDATSGDIVTGGLAATQIERMATSSLVKTDSGGLVTTGQALVGNIATDAVGSAQIQPDAVGASEIGPDAVGSGEILDGSVGTAEIGASAVTAQKIASNAIFTTHLADNAVATAELLDGAVTTNKLGASAVTAQKIASNAIFETHINPDAVGTPELIASSVTTQKLNASAVTTIKLDVNAVLGGNIGGGAVSTTKLANDAVTTAKIADDAVTNAKIVNDTVGQNKMKLLSIGAGELQASAVTAPKIAIDAVLTTNILASAVTATKLALNAVGAGHIIDGSVGAAELAASSVNANRIVSSATELATWRDVLKVPGLGTQNDFTNRNTIQRSSDNSALDIARFSDAGTADMVRFRNAANNATVGRVANSGAWRGQVGVQYVSFTPTWNNVTIGNATVVARYALIGELCFFEVTMTFGSTTSISGSVSIQLPTATNALLNLQRGWGQSTCEDASPTAVYWGTCLITTAIAPRYFNVNGTRVDIQVINATQPFTWVTSDILQFAGSYPAVADS